jgi:hypothetical protein
VGWLWCVSLCDVTLTTCTVAPTTIDFLAPPAVDYRAALAPGKPGSTTLTAAALKKALEVRARVCDLCGDCARCCVNTMACILVYTDDAATRSAL